jgi:hypothetical protein
MTDSKEQKAILFVSTLMVLSIATIIWQYDYINQALWSRLTWQDTLVYTLLGIAILGVTYRVAFHLRSGPDWLKFSWLKLIPPLRNHAENVAALPMKLMAPLAVVYMVLLTYTLPAIAFIEEAMFRTHIRGIASAVVVTVVFALVHFLVGATIGGSIALVVPGGFFALVYSVGGGDLVAATYLHVFYDVAAIALVMAIFVKEKRAGYDPVPASE